MTQGAALQMARNLKRATIFVSRMTYHILNGDVLADKFPADEIPGEPVVIREAFVEGPLALEFSNEYWDKRAEFISGAYQTDKAEYDSRFLSQLLLLDGTKDEDEVFLWFEDDLFCLVNIWFVIYYLSHKTKSRLFRVFPEKDDKRWIGFGKADKEELIQSYQEAQIFTDDEIELSNQLWESYVRNDRQKLKALSFSDSVCFRFLPQIIQAHLDRYPEDGNPGRPHQTLIEIMSEGKTNFYEILKEFWKKDAIYGFGDLQVYNILKEMEIEFSSEI